MSEVAAHPYELGLVLRLEIPGIKAVDLFRDFAHAGRWLGNFPVAKTGRALSCPEFEQQPLHFTDVLLDVLDHRNISGQISRALVRTGDQCASAPRSGLRTWKSFSVSWTSRRPFHSLTSGSKATAQVM